jgi:hypothetical protein
VVDDHGRITATNCLCFFQGQLVDPQRADRLAGPVGPVGLAEFLLVLGMPVVPAGQRGLGDAEEGGRPGNVGAADEGGGLPDNAGRRSGFPTAAGGQQQARGRPHAAAVLAVVLEDPHLQPHRAVAQRQIDHVADPALLVDTLARPAAVGAGLDHQTGHDAEVPLAVLLGRVDDLVLRQVQSLRPDRKPWRFVHSTPTHD